jgi:hypothetical protein
LDNLFEYDHPHRTTNLYIHTQKEFTYTNAVTDDGTKLKDKDIHSFDHLDISEYDDLLDIVKNFPSEEDFAGVFDGITEW